MAQKRISFADFLVHLIEESKLTQNEFAKKIDVASGTITKYKSGEEEPTLEFLRKLSHGTGYDLLTLLRFAYPDEFPAPEIDPDLVAFNRKFKRLSQDIQNFILAAVRDMPAEGEVDK